MKESGDMESERLQDIYERLDELDASTAETKAARLLHGLGEPLTQQFLSLHAYPSPQFLVVGVLKHGDILTCFPLSSGGVTNMTPSDYRWHTLSPLDTVT